MADDAANPATQEASVQVQEVVLKDVPQPEKTVDKDPQSVLDAAPLKPVEETAETEVSKPGSEGDDKMPESGSFKEESTRVADLSDHEKKALQELKQLVQHALNKHDFSAPPNPLEPPKDDKPEPAPAAPFNDDDSKTQEPIQEKPAETADPTKTEDRQEDKKETASQEVVDSTAVDDKTVSPAVDDDGAKTVEAIEESVVAVSSAVPAEEPLAAKESEGAAIPPLAEPETKETKDETPLPPPPQEVSVWGIPLLADERSDVILLKFLRARDFKVKDAFTMIKNTILWRKEFGIDKLMEENLSDDLEKAVFMHGLDKEGHPVCYNIYGEFQNKELYKKAFSDEERRLNFLRWRIQFLERSIRKLDFTPGSVSTIVQINDLKNSPGPGKWELRQATKQALHLLQDNYPEFVAKQIFVNVPWWYLAVNRMISPFLTQRTKSKFVFAGPSKSAETLLRYIAPEQLPVKYGGLSKDGEFGNTDAVTEVTVKPAGKHTIEFPVNEKCLLSWELRVIGWDVSYGAEFVPSAEGSYTVIIQKARKVASSEEPVVCNSFEIGEPGKVVLTIDNPSSKKKKLLYRLKTKSSA
ncbi:patellin-3-like [Prosopis cineraria]|uniref:patellin-3-like n=1 Tax=Prosopis cineraria TaxID=364024 RepID=UPI002410AB42|nr:patellin-3-like [Prosopis cineraria]